MLLKILFPYILQGKHTFGFVTSNAKVNGGIQTMRKRSLASPKAHNVVHARASLSFQLSG
jgi:hypothetical protein